MTETSLIYKIASLYYEENQTQQEIANRMGISRIKVSRLLQLARSNGIVEISLKKKGDNFADLENHIASEWNLKEVIITSADSNNKEEILSQLGKAASEYAQRILSGNEIIGMTWGRSLSAFLQSLPGLEYPNLKIVQMLGGLGSPEATVHSSDLVRRFSEKTGGIGRILSAPGVVTSMAVKEGLLKDPHISETLETAEHADLAFVGIGTPASDSMLMSRGTIISQQILDELKTNGAVGDISLRFFDENGQIISHPINDRVIGINAESLGNIPRVVALAGGLEKKQAVIGALRSGIIDVLITDSKTAKNLSKE